MRTRGRLGQSGAASLSGVPIGNMTPLISRSAGVIMNAAHHMRLALDEGEIGMVKTAGRSGYEIRAPKERRGVRFMPVVHG